MVLCLEVKGTVEKEEMRVEDVKANCGEQQCTHPSLSLSFATFSVCILSLFTTAVHSIWLSRKYHPFIRSACPWYLLIYSSNRTVTVLAKLNLVLPFAAELLMLMVRCNYYLSDLICWMTLMGFKMLPKPVPFTKCSVPARGHMTGAKDGQGTAMGCTGTWACDP